MGVGRAGAALSAFGVWLSRRARAALVVMAGFSTQLLTAGVLEGKARDVALAVIAVATVFGVHITPNPPGIR